MSEGEDERWLRMASLLAEESDCTRARVGCVFVKKGRTMACGCNSKNTHPLLREWNYPEYSGTHAEMAASVGVHRASLKGCTVYVARIGKGGEMRLAEPCRCCSLYLASLGVKRVVWSR